MEEMPNSQYLNMSDLDIDSLLNYQSQYSGFGGLLDHIAHDALKEKALKNFNDTYKLMPIFDFKKLIESSPFLFKKVYQKDSLECQELMFFSCNGILLYVEVANDGRIDQARAWFQIDFKNAKLYTLHGKSSKIIKDWIAEIEIKADEAFIYQLAKYDLCGGEILPKWIKYNTPSILTLNELDFIEYEENQVDLAKLMIVNKLNKLPKNVQEAILFKGENND